MSSEPPNDADPVCSPLVGWELCWLFVVLLASGGLIVHTSQHIGPTFDEPFYVKQGLEYWRSGSAKTLMRAGTMPLPVDVQTLPLYLWELYRGTALDCIEDLDRLLPIARQMNLLFWAVLLVSGFRLARRWGGPARAAVAVGLLGFEPNLIAHAALATTDTALTAAVLAATNAFLAGRGQAWRRRVLVPGLWTGIAVLCKASAVTFVPILFALGLWYRGKQRRLLRDGIPIAFIATAVLFTYVGSDWAIEPSFVKWANTLPESDLGDSVRSVAYRLRIFPNAAEGIIQQIKHNIRGHGVYTLGEYHSRAVWYYFPVVLSQKLALPVLVLFAGGLLRRPRAIRGLPLVFVLALLLFSLTCRVQIGIRLVLPLLAFLILAASVNAALGWGRLAVLAMAAVAFHSAPHGLRYQNELWGGIRQSGQTLTDSNCDWGQGIPELRDWWQTHGEPKLVLWYYGTDLNAFRPPFQPLPLHVLPDRRLEFVQQASAGGYFAVGRTFLTACPDRRPDMLKLIARLQAQRPVAEVGCFVIYQLD